MPGTRRTRAYNACMSEQSPTYFTYVLRCADGTLYCGYSTDVEARVATHNAGQGAKYTKARRPVALVASARFASKHDAMSAEWHFKQLSRSEKEQALEQAHNGTPFENVLASLFDLNPNKTDIELAIEERIAKLADEKYAQFMRPLIPTIDETLIVGVRTPDLKALARELSSRSDIALFLGALPHRTFEENQLHAFELNRLKDYDALVERLEAFLPYVDNWATCDQLRPPTLAKQPAQTASLALAWIARGQREGMPYMTRYGIGVLMRWFLDERFEPSMMDAVVNVEPGTYYIDMMRAWYVAEALVKQPEAALAVIHENRLDAWTHNKAIQKARESRRVSSSMKEALAKLRK